MANISVVEQFVAQELSPHVREVLREALQQRADSDKVLARHCEFNCFDVEFDFLEGVAVIQNILASGEGSSVEIPIADFVVLCSLNDH